ncbi:TolC family protein [Paludibaculum fermentans]|uniref:TolC family protein n=1 Tax=Paludibaculum fermentans TaxID=1473598 RepID=A0A7S7NVI0_PALFE|nr:TolC family protein [Paludibaculum fermentans]QOY90587.1 TolC family protein [Paludibaculum fermentans]
MLRSYPSLLALLFGASWALGQTPDAITSVDQLIQQSLAQNREIQAVQQRLAEARGRLRQAGNRPVPTLELNAGSGRPLGTTGEEEYSIGYFQPIETGGKRPKRLLVAEKEVELADAELAERKRQLSYEIKARYIDAVASLHKVEAIDRIVAVNREAYRLVDARVQRDDAAPLDRQLLLVEVNRTEAQRSMVAGQAQSAEVELRRAAALPSSEPLKLPTAPVAPSAPGVTLEELRRRALEVRPDLRVARTLSAQSTAELDLVQAQGRPDVTVSAQYARRYSQFEDPIRVTGRGSPLLLQDRDNVLTLGVSIPLQTRKRNQGNVEAAAARQSAAQLRGRHLEVTAGLEVEAAWARYEAARKTVAIFQRGVVDESNRNLAIIRQAYELGQLRLLDVLNEQRRQLETQLSAIDAEAELARSAAELERAAGGELK